MADLNRSLKDYLSKSQSTEPLLNAGGGGSSSINLSRFNPFAKQKVTDEDGSGDVASSWFAQAQKDPCFPSLTKKQRILGFVLCLCMGTFCFTLACLYIPLLLLKARKFAMLYTLGSLFIIGSFSMLWGPMNHVKHLCSVGRLPFTFVYFGTMFATIYFSIWVRSTIFTVIFAVLQILALLWCRCKNCINMPTVAESKCCKTTNIVDGKVEAEGLACITDHDGFRANCLNKHVLEVAFYDHVLQTGPLEENQKLHELYRHLAYRRFVRWVYGLLGKGVRKVIPSCAVTAIRNMFPSEEYCGFKYPK